LILDKDLDWTIIDLVFAKPVTG